MRTRACLIAAIWLLSAAAARADEAAEAAGAFNSLYGDEYKRVTATPSPADDVALARKLLEGAKAVNQPALLAVLCDKAYELGAKDPAGNAAAIEAMDLLAARSPEKKADCLARCVAIYQRQFAAAPSRSEAKAMAAETLAEALTHLGRALMAKGDADGSVAALRQAVTATAGGSAASKAAVQAELSTALARQIFAKQAVALRGKLAANPADAESRKELVRLLVVEFDNPAEAAKYLDATLDEPTRKCVPAAARPVAETPESDCLDLARWFQDLAARTTTPFGKAAMLWRARDCYERFLDLHWAADLPLAAAELGLAKTQEALDALGPAGKRPGGSTPLWTDCLKQIDLKKATGQWEFKDGALVGTYDSNQSSSLTLPFPPAASYQLRMTIARLTGNENLFFWLSAAPGSFHLSLTNPLSKIYVIGAKPDGPGRGQVDLVSKSAAAFPGKQSTTLEVRVLVDADKTSLVVLQDNKPFLEWTGPTSAIEPLTYPLQARLNLSKGGITIRRMQFRQLPPGAKLPAATL